MVVFLPMGVGMFLVFFPAARRTWFSFLPLVGQQLHLQRLMDGSAVPLLQSMVLGCLTLALAILVMLASSTGFSVMKSFTETDAVFIDAEASDPLDRNALENDFDRLVAANGPALTRLAASYTNTLSDRDDLLQEIAMALWQALPRFRGECSSGHSSSGLRTIARSLIWHELGCSPLGGRGGRSP